MLLATYGRPDLLPRALASASAQTLPSSEYEVLVIANGPHQHVPALVADARAAHPDVAFRLLETNESGAGMARNLGICAARGEYVTVLDDDDWIAPGYLEGLLRGAQPNVVPLGDLAEVKPGESAESFDNYVSNATRPKRGTRVSPTAVPQGLSLNVCKLLPTLIAREVLYDESLRSGEDFVFWTHVYARYPFEFEVLPGTETVYYRWRGENSVSRRSLSFDFNVVERLACIQALDRIPPAPAEVEKLIRGMMTAQAGFVRRYLTAHPGAEEAERAEQAYRDRAIGRLSWDAFLP